MKSAKDILKDHKAELLRSLPLEDEKFLAKLEKSQLLTDGNGASIRAQIPSHNKVAYFLQYVVEYAPAVYLPLLICAMEQSDNLAVKKLANDIREKGMYVRMYTLCIIILCQG